MSDGNYLKKSSSPCCKSAYKNLHQIHFCWSPDLIQWYCEKCKKEYTEREIFNHVEKELGIIKIWE